MPWGFDSDYGSRRIKDQMSDLFNPSDPDPTYQNDMGNSFGVPRITSADYQQALSPGPDNDFYSGLAKVYGAPHPSMDAYRDFLKTAPQIADYQPSKMTRLAAGLSGLSAGFKDAGRGIQVAQGLNRSRYDTALQDYATQGKSLGESAKLESDDRDNMLKYYMQAGALENTRTKNQFDRMRDQATDRWHQGTLNETRDYHGKLIGQGDKRLGMEQNNFNSLDSYRKGGLRNQQTGLGIQQQNADTNRDRANTEWANSALNGGGRAGSHAVTANDVGTAEADVLRTMAVTSPVLATRDSLTGKVMMNPRPSDPVLAPQWDAAMAEYQRRVLERSHGGGGFGGGYGQFGNIPNPNSIPVGDRFQPMQDDEDQ